MGTLTPRSIQLCKPLISVSVLLGVNSSPNGYFPYLTTAESLLNVTKCLDLDGGETYTGVTDTSYIRWTSSPLELVFEFGQETTYTITGLLFWNYYSERYTEYYDVDQIDLLFYDQQGILLSNSTIMPRTGRAGNGIDFVAERIILVPVQGVASVSATLVGVDTIFGSPSDINFQNMIFLGFKE